MKTDRVFNTTFETSLRILILLDESEIDLDEQVIRTGDFMATYGKEFDISKDSANGDNPYMYCELAARKILTDEAIRKLVVDGRVMPSATSTGFLYRTTLSGHRLAESLASVYAEEYRKAACSALELINSLGVESIIAMMKSKSKNAIDTENDDE